MPGAEGRCPVETLAAGCAAAQAGQVSLDASLVEEDQAVRLGAHACLAVGGPEAARVAHVGALTLLRHQAFFYMNSRPG